MLVFFIHGVATRNNSYADELKNNLRKEFSKKRLSAPQFYSSLWGGILNNTSQTWSYVKQDLNFFDNRYKIDIGDIFQYKEHREFFITHFFGDLFTYLNPEYGRDIRNVIASQFLDFLNNNPENNELHLVAHSLGGVILWDILFSERFSANDPAFEIREVIKGLSTTNSNKKVVLRSITTMGSPILLFNVMLGISPDRLKYFASRYTGKPLRWINIIHASDVLAYPIKASLNIDACNNLFLQDKFIASHNLAKKIAQPLAGLSNLSMAKGLESSHTSYWKRERVARLITANFLGDFHTINTASPYKNGFKFSL